MNGASVTPRRPALLGLITALALGGAGACNDGTDSARVQAATEKWRTDSAEYQTRLAQWLRDSVVIDSIARTISDDSLRSLYRILIRSDRPAPITQAIACEQWRLSGRYGHNAAGIVIRRVWAVELGPDSNALLDRVDDKMRTTMITLSEEECGERRASAPAQIGGTSLNRETPRPRPPRRPGPFYP